jgi:Mrp family chromosome partitioning ATPase
LFSKTSSSGKHKAQPIEGFTSKGKVRKGYIYAELHRIRERIVDNLPQHNQKTLMVTSPHDDAGNTFLISLLGFNIASFSSTRVLLADLNMRRPQLHLPFELEREKGFTEVATGSLNWKEAVKDTDLSGLKILTAGQPNGDLYYFISPSLIENLILDMKRDFDLIIFDTSPVLVHNRNNVDPILLSLLCGMVIMVTQDKKTPKADLRKAIFSITDGGGKVNGIIYNKQFRNGVDNFVEEI